MHRCLGVGNVRSVGKLMLPCGVYHAYCRRWDGSLTSTVDILSSGRRACIGALHSARLFLPLAITSDGLPRARSAVDFGMHERGVHERLKGRPLSDGTRMATGDLGFWLHLLLRALSGGHVAE